MKLVVGLGNPGRNYENTRHNIGFMAIDRLLEGLELSTSPSKKFNSELAEYRAGDRHVIFLKPLSFMNNSGVPVSQVANFYKINLEDIMVFYDELDLTHGKIRIKTGGSDGGHNGIKSIDANLGKGYKRIRLGISHPGDKDLVHGYVLGKFTAEEKKLNQKLLESIASHIGSLIDGYDDRFMSKIALDIKDSQK